MMGWLLVALAAAEPPPPSEHTVVYYNARMALREGKPLEAVKLWLLRNAMEDQTGQVSSQDDDFRSVTWAALGQLGICQDGHPTDEDGAGLWPLALHNWVVSNMGRRPPKRAPPFASYAVGRQQRFISVNDVLSARELEAVDLSRGMCARPRLTLIAMGESVTAELADRQVSARLMVHLLEQARDTLVGERVRGTAAIEARLFDLDLQLTALAAREARQQSSARARRGRALGLSRESVEVMRRDAEDYTFEPDSKPARILRESVRWPASEWMALSPDRRLFLFHHARTFGGDPDTLDEVALGIIDQLIEAGDGEAVETWIGQLGSGEDVVARPDVWDGERGQRLLALDRETGFGERSVIALHRGVHQLEQGDLDAALRSMAFALQQAPDSQVSDQVQGLSLRWLSYVASQFEITDALLLTLQELVPARDYSAILEDLMWHAAFHADAVSFQRGLDNQVGRGALERRLALLLPLAEGDVGQFSMGIRDGLSTSPSETLRFLDQLVQRLELEDADVRGVHVQTLANLRDLLWPLTPEAGGATTGRQGKTASELMDRTQAMLEGAGALGATAGSRDRARSLSPTGEVFAGSVRLAPADRLPWPFRASVATAPSVFVPLTLTPVEWRDDGGDWVFGWSIGG